jgi:hypothetical protein
MARLVDYAKLCRDVYAVPGTGAPDGWKVLESWRTATGFKGAIFLGANELVVAYAGTDTSTVWDFVPDATADLRLLLDMPRQTSDAYYLYNKAVELQGRHGAGEMTICGHSLGGALSQHVGYWTKNRFVTFNAPGVYTGIQGTKVAFLHSPQKAVRTLLATFSGSADGRNYRLSDDMVSRIGVHYGRLEVLLPGGGATGHGISECIKALAANGQGGTPLFG